MKRIKKKSKGLVTKFIKNLRESFYQALLIGLAIVGTLQFVSWRQDRSIAKEIDAKTPLTEEDVRRLIIDLLRDRIVIQTKGKDTEVYSGIRKAVFTEKKDGEIKADIPTKGLTIEPGAGLLIGDGLRLGVDVQYAYWKRWGLLAGASMPVQGRSLDRLRGHAGISYSPYFKWAPNTSMFAGIDTNADPTFGVRHRF